MTRPVSRIVGRGEPELEDGDADPRLPGWVSVAIIVLVSGVLWFGLWAIGRTLVEALR